MDSSPNTAWLAEVSAIELLDRLAEGSLTEEALVAACLGRIGALDRLLHAMTAIDPGASAAGAGPLAGLPVLIKDNVDVAGLPTTAGSLALVDNVPLDDAFVVARIRRAGAVLLGKTNLSEWANFRSTRSSSGWSAIGGQTRNPHAVDRSPCGSSSGSAVAVAVGYAPLAVGTETDGSILCPAGVNGVVGVKPTLGLVSRDGIVPIAPSQDTAGPIARSVFDAALLLEVMAAHDPGDRTRLTRPDDLDTRYRGALRADALQGTRIGVPWALLEFHRTTLEVFRDAIADLERLGATVVEVQAALPVEAEIWEFEVLTHEFPEALRAYLASAPEAVTVRCLDDVIAFDEAHADQELRWFGQELLELCADHPADCDYATACEAGPRAHGAELIDALVAEHGLDALVVPTNDPAWPIDLVLGDHHGRSLTSITAVSGYPAVTVPMGQVHGLPVGISFLGRAWQEARLLALAHAYEVGTRHRVVPKLTRGPSR